MANAFFSDLLSSIADRGRALLSKVEWPIDLSQKSIGISDLCDALLSGRGEASGVAIARETLERYARLTPDEKLAFFSFLASNYGPDRDVLRRSMDAWTANPGPETETELHFAAEPRRQELFRRLNRAPGGTQAIVQMREDLLDFKRSNPELATVDKCMSHLLASWFNRGFLVLRKIDWSTPAIVLEKIIRYEAVHEIRDWDDLRRRIDPVDRRCYAFFHPALIDEPLIFVEVALTEAIPGSIAPLLTETRALAQPDKAKTAVFYSISNCQQGLQGISFGNFLIKQVVEELRRELPKLETFVTLSPVPGFQRWVTSEAGAEAGADPTLVATLADFSWASDPARVESLRKPLELLASEYFIHGKARDGRVADPVARFHLGNGARLERINWLGDTSLKALREGAGLMVNYLYDLDAIEENHEAYANHGTVVASNAVKRMGKPARPRLQLSAGSSN
jgi:malonyl-CoA decarboxylase